MAAARPVVAEVADEREAEHVDRPQPRRQRERADEARPTAVAQLFDVREPLPPQPQQQSHAHASERAVAQPLDERRTGDHAAEVHPRPHVAQCLGGVGSFDRGPHVRPALAERYEDRGLVRPARKEVHERLRVFRHRRQARHGRELRRPPQFRREREYAFAIGPRMRVFAVECARHHDDARGRTVESPRVARFDPLDQRPVPRGRADALVQRDGGRVDSGGVGVSGHRRRHRASGQERGRR